MTTEAQVSQSYILYLFGADKCHPSFSYIDSLDKQFGFPQKIKIDAQQQKQHHA